MTRNSNEMVTGDDLIFIAPKLAGLAALKADIAEGRHAFSICGVGRDYHVGAKDAEETFNRAVEREQLEARRGVWADDTIYVPRNPEPALRAEVARSERFVRERAQRVYELLREAFPAYKVGLRLHQQEPPIRENVTRAFFQLRQVGALPATTGNSAFNHQGMVMLVEACFLSRRKFLDYLRDPGMLVPSSLDIQLRTKLKFAEAAGIRAQIAALVSQNWLGMRILDRLSGVGERTAEELQREVARSTPLGAIIAVLVLLAQAQLVRNAKKGFAATERGGQVLADVQKRAARIAA